MTAPAGTYEVEVFSTPVAGWNGIVDGRTYLGTRSITHAGGTVLYSTTVGLLSANVLTVTLTENQAGDLGSTSPFSTAFTVVQSPLVAVNSTDDDGDLALGDGVCDTGQANDVGGDECTLRAAIQEANAHAAVDSIAFAMPAADSGHAGGVWTITPASGLPAITAPVTIDGATQTGWAANTSTTADNAVLTVALDGVGAGSSSGLVLGGAGVSMVRGMAIGRFALYGIDVQTGGNIITGSRIGVASNGADRGAQWRRRGQDLGSIEHRRRCHTPLRNVISGNIGTGVYVYAANGNTIVGNLIGTNAAGTSAVPNAHGVRLHLAGGNTVGGAGSGLGNLISGNTGNGVWLRSGGTSNNVISGNRIGTAAGGSGSVPNGTGILVDDATSSNLIGGTVRAAANVVAGNSGAGIVLHGSAGVPPQNTAIIGNSIRGNGGLGIDLRNDGATANDVGDGDSGENGLLNSPVLVAATAMPTTTPAAIIVDLDLDVPAADYRIEVFANPGGVDPSGRGEGEQFLGATLISHAGGGVRRFSITVPGDSGAVLSSTATVVAGSAYGATSEFSNTVATLASGGAVVDRSVRRSDLIAAGGAALGAVAGVAATGLDVGGGTQRFVGPATNVTSGALSVSGWVRLDALGGAPRLVAKSDGAGGLVHELLVDGVTGEAVARMVIGGSTVEVRGGAVTVAAWHQLAATWDGATVRLYVDGAEVDSAVASGALALDLEAPLVVGNTANASGPLDGRIDQVRVGHVARSAADLATEQANVSQPAAFVSLGVRQTAAPAAWTTSTSVHRTGTHALQAPHATPGTAAWATAQGLDEPGLAFESWWYLTSPATGLVAAGTHTGAAPTDQSEAGAGAGGFDVATSSGPTRTVTATQPGTLAAGTWTRVEVRTDELGRTSSFVGGVQVIGPTAQPTGQVSGSAGLRAVSLPTGDWYVDDVAIRRYVSDEPTTTLGPIARR